MLCESAYLEAEERTQKLLTVKWAVRSAGYSVSSVWHDADARALSKAAKEWGNKEFERLRRSQVLIVLAEQTQPAAMRVATMFGFALAHRIQVCWVGPAVEAIRNLQGVQIFDTVDDFCRYLLHAASAAARLPETMAA